jgi:hypothetical protein
MQNLALQIGEIDRIEVQQANFAYASRRQIQSDGRSQSACADAKDAGRADLSLPGKAHFRQDQMPRIPANFVVVQLHTNQYRWQPS